MRNIQKLSEPVREKNLITYDTLTFFYQLQL